TEIARAFPVYLLRPEAFRVTLVEQPLDAGRHVEPELPTGENRAGTAPRQFATFVSLVGRDQLRQPLEIGLRRCKPLQHQPNSRLAPPEAALVVLFKIWLRFERTL